LKSAASACASAGRRRRIPSCDRLTLLIPARRCTAVAAHTHERVDGSATPAARSNAAPTDGSGAPGAIT
jgi:hypothetical protein